MFTCDMNRRGKLAKYEYLYKAIKADIISKKLEPNSKLPSKRALAEHLGISVVTVETAYDQLVAEGYVVSRVRSGYFVSELMHYPSREEKMLQVKRPKKREYYVDFSGHTAITSDFPLSVWARLMRRTLNRPDALSSVDYNGAFELRYAISSYLKSMRGMNVDPELIIIGAGTEHLYNMIVQLLGSKKIYAVENPGYKKISKIYLANGVTCKYIGIDEEGASIEGLEADILHISPAHHFPTGVVMTALRRREALKWANDRGGYIIEDEYDSEFRLKGMPIEPIWSNDANGRVIYINTFSKSISPSLRISYMILPEKLMQQYREKLGFYSCAVPAFEQYTLASFIKEGFFEKHINRVKTRSRAVRQKLIKCMKQSGLSKRIIERDAGQHFMIELNTAASTQAVRVAMERQDIRLTFLSDYMVGQKSIDERLAIINYSTLKEENIVEAVKRMKRALTSLI